MTCGGGRLRSKLQPRHSLLRSRRLRALPAALLAAEALRASERAAPPALRRRSCSRRVARRSAARPPRRSSSAPALCCPRATRRRPLTCAQRCARRVRRRCTCTVQSFTLRAARPCVPRPQARSELKLWRTWTRRRGLLRQKRRRGVRSRMWETSQMSGRARRWGLALASMEALGGAGLRGASVAACGGRTLPLLGSACR